MSNTNKNKKWFESEVGAEIVRKKYLHEGEKDVYDLAKRVSSIFSTDLLRLWVEKAIIDADFFPAGRSLYAIGCKGKFSATTANCFILPSPEDDLKSIFDVAKEMAIIFSRGGGTGINLSNLRPKGAKVNNVAKTSTGAVSFMDLYNQVGTIISQNGRRGALLLGLNCDHPDIEDFLKIKQNNTSIQSANISILFTDEFMECVKENKNYTLKFNDIEKIINARQFFMDFCESNKNYAEPGAIFIDSVRNNHLLSNYKEYKIDTCNPCGEFFGNSYNSCNLGSINLYNMVSNPFTIESILDVNKLRKTVDMAVRALDEILDYGYDLQPLDKNRENITNYRAIGLGVFGLSEMFVSLGIKYGSDRSIEFTKNVMRVIFTQALRTSCDLAKEKSPFMMYNFCNELPKIITDNCGQELINDIQEYGIRNGNLLSIAPTGSISTMCGVSGGLEPYYKISYLRSTHSLVEEKKYFKVYAKAIEDLLLSTGIEPDTMSVDEIKNTFPYAVDTYDVTPKDRIKMQAAIQLFVDNAISSTINLTKGTTTEEIFNLYLSAWENKTKGITVFVDDCLRTSILGKSENTTEEKLPSKKLDSITPLKRGKQRKMDGSTFVGATACVPKLYTTVNIKEGNIFELFTNVSSGCKSNINVINRLASLAIRSGVEVREVIGELKSNICPACSTLKSQGNNVSMSCGSCIGEALEEAYLEIQGKGKADTKGELLACPECKEKTLRPEGKCFTCSNCGYSRCD